MTHKITLLVFSEDDTPETAVNNATSRVEEYILPNRNARRIQTETHPTDQNQTHVLPLDTQQGENLLQNALDRTQAAQKTILTDLVDKLNTNNFDELLEDDDFRHNCWRLGADHSRVFSFYDGTDQHAGSPIHSRKNVEMIKQNCDLPLYLVVLNLL